MQYLILSDLHLREKFEQGKMKFIMNLISKFENIILNGDFYEAKYYDANKFLNSKYKPLLELLKSKNTIYIYGNHDPKRFAEKIAKFISNNNDKLNLKIAEGNHLYHIEHGDRLSHPNGMDTMPVWLIKIIDSIAYQVEKYIPKLALWEGSKWNKNVLLNRYKDGLINKEEILICGHTHVKVFDLENKYVDTGYSKYGHGNYALIDEKGISLIPFTYAEN